MGVFNANFNTTTNKANSALAGMGGYGGASGGSYIPALTPPDTTEADNAAFAHAKDQVGEQGRSAVQSLNDELGAAGMMGSGAQAAGTRDIVRAGQGQLGDVRRQQAMAAAQRAEEYAKLNYEGSLTQRGQDITQRGQDIGAMTSEWLAQYNSQFSQQNSSLALLQMILGTLGGAL